MKLLRYEEREYAGISYHLRVYGHREGSACYSIFYEMPDSRKKGLHNSIVPAAKECDVSSSILHQQRQDGVIERIAVRAFGWIGTSANGRFHSNEYAPRAQVSDESLLEAIGEENRESLRCPKCYTQKQREAFAELALERDDLRKIEKAAQNAKEPWNPLSNSPAQREDHGQKMTR